MKSAEEVARNAWNVANEPLAALDWRASADKIADLIRARDAEVAEQVRAEVVSEIVAGYLKECAPSGVWMAAWLQQFSEPDDGLIRARDAEVAAQALRDAADEFYGDDRAAGPYRHPLSGASWLRERADRIEREGGAS